MGARTRAQKVACQVLYQVSHKNKLLNCNAKEEYYTLCFGTVWHLLRRGAVCLGQWRCSGPGSFKGLGESALTYQHGVFRHHNFLEMRLHWLRWFPSTQQYCGAGTASAPAPAPQRQRPNINAACHPAVLTHPCRPAVLTRRSIRRDDNGACDGALM